MQTGKLIPIGVIVLTAAAMLPLGGCTTREALIGLGAGAAGAAGGALVTHHVDEDNARDEHAEHVEHRERERDRAEHDAAVREDERQRLAHERWEREHRRY